MNNLNGTYTEVVGLIVGGSVVGLLGNNYVNEISGKIFNTRSNN